MSNLNDLVAHLKRLQTDRSFVTVTVERPPLLRPENYTGQVTAVGEGSMFMTNGPGKIDIVNITCLNLHVPGEDLRPEVQHVIAQTLAKPGP